MATDKELRRYHSKRLDKRNLDELIGLAAGVVADGVVNQAEAEFIHKWLVANSDVVNNNPIIRPLLKRIKEMLSDNFLDDEEAEELLETLQAFAGTDFELGELTISATSFFNDPAPKIDFEDKIFCFTGTFASYNRDECTKIIENLGGVVAKNITQKTDYVVIAKYATETWKHTKFGNKIKKAIEYRDEKGLPIALISEDYWLAEIDMTDKPKSKPKEKKTKSESKKETPKSNTIDDYDDANKSSPDDEIETISTFALWRVIIKYVFLFSLAIGLLFAFFFDAGVGIFAFLFTFFIIPIFILLMRFS